MKEFAPHENGDLDGLKDAVETINESLSRARLALAEIEARLAWSHSRQRHLPGWTESPRAQESSK